MRVDAPRDTTASTIGDGLSEDGTAGSVIRDGLSEGDTTASAINVRLSEDAQLRWRRVGGVARAARGRRNANRQRNVKGGGGG